MHANTHSLTQHTHTLIRARTRCIHTKPYHARMHRVFSSYINKYVYASTEQDKNKIKRYQHSTNDAHTRAHIHSLTHTISKQ